MIGKGRASGGGRQAGDVDIVLDHKGDAEQRLALGAGRLQSGGDRERFDFRAQRDEDGGIVVGCDAGVGLVDCIGQLFAGGMGCQNGFDRQSHAQNSPCGRSAD